MMSDPIEPVDASDDCGGIEQQPELARRKRRTKCYESKHTDRLVQTRGDAAPRVKCTTCGDEFPCRSECGHWNCMVATGRALPEECSQTAESIAEDNAAFFAKVAR